MGPFLGELVGTACLVMLGDSVMARIRLGETEVDRDGEARIALGWAAATFTGLLIASAASGAHLNPALTLGLFMSGMFPGASVPTYLLAQFLGALIGAVLAWLACLPQWNRGGSSTAVLGCFCAVPPVRAPLGNLLGGVIGSFVVVLAFLVLWGMVPTPQAPEVMAGRALPWAIGYSLIVLAASACLGAGVTLGLNPARDLGGRAVHALLPIPGKSGSDWGTGGIAIVGALLGSSLAAWMFRLLGLAAT